MYSIETKQPDTDYVLQFKFLRPLSAVSAEYGRYRKVFFFLSYHTALHGRCVFVRTSSRRLPVYADWRRPEVGPQHEKQLPYCWWDVIRASISLVHVIRVVLNKKWLQFAAFLHLPVYVQDIYDEFSSKTLSLSTCFPLARQKYLAGCY